MLQKRKLIQLTTDEREQRTANMNCVKKKLFPIFILRFR